MNSIDDIKATVARHYDLPVSVLAGHVKVEPIQSARYAAVWLSILNDANAAEISLAFGYSKPQVYYVFKAVRTRREVDPQFRRDTDALLRLCVEPNLQRATPRPAALAVAVALLLSLSPLTPAGRASQHPTYDAEAMATAIYFAEGGAKARVPYGVLSVRVKDHAEARAVTLRSLARARRDWIAAGSRGEFVDFFCDRWCPRAADAVGNVNLKRNVRWFLRR